MALMTGTDDDETIVKRLQRLPQPEAESFHGPTRLVFRPPQTVIDRFTDDMFPVVQPVIVVSGQL